MKDMFKGIGDFKSRVTIDWDTKNKFIIAYRFFKIINKIKRKDLTGIKFNPSNSKGFHLIIYIKKRLSDKKINYYRKLFNDDKMRIIYDKKENPKQILFLKKRKMKGGIN